MHKTEDYTPKNDFIFKEIFSDEEILKDFLESVLKEKIYTIKIEEDVNIRTMLKDKVGILDLRAEINGKKYVAIEMQKANKYNMEKRTLYYGGKIVAKMLKRGATYKEMKPIVLINILNHKMIKLPQYYTKTVTVAENYREYEVVKGIQYGFIELEKFRAKKPNIEDKLEQWLIFIDNNNEELVKMVTEKNSIIAKAEEKRKYLTGKAAEERIQELREKAEFDENSAYEAGRELGEKRGKKEGRKIGKKEGIIQTAKAMIQNKINFEIIAKCTGLSKSEIQKISQYEKEIAR